MQEIGCILCNVKSDNIAITENGYQGRRCGSCGLIYISPRPPADEIENIYACGTACLPPPVHLRRGHLKRLYARHTLKLIKSYVGSGKLLEIGAGAGFFLDEARRSGFEPYAVEPNPSQADFIEKTLNIPCERRELSLTTFGNTTFDLIYHSDVISHFHDPIDAFRTILSKLNRGGYLVFETGNFADVHPKYLRSIPTFQYPDHLFFFGSSALRTLLSRTGFQLLNVYSYSIITELRLAKVLGRGHSSAANGQNGHSSGIAYAVKEMVRPAYYKLMSFVRYQVGSWMPKTGRPQTVIVIAQKI